MKFFIDKKGSISILLIIVLLPTLALGGIMLDLARLHLAKSMISSAGDVAMNAALANYDSVVQDVYGLFAMSQNDAELEENVAQYFKNTLIQNNIMLEADADDYVAQLMTETFHGDLMNFMEMEVNDIRVQGVPGTSLADPGVLKKQIVEYMKYRGPIEISTSFIDSLDIFAKVGDQTAVIDKKIETDEALGELQKTNNKLYTQINEFEVIYNSYKTDTVETRISKINTLFANELDEQIEKVLMIGETPDMESGSKNPKHLGSDIDKHYNEIAYIHEYEEEEYPSIQKYFLEFNSEEVNSMNSYAKGEIEAAEAKLESAKRISSENPKRAEKISAAQDNLRNTKTEYMPYIEEYSKHIDLYKKLKPIAEEIYDRTISNVEVLKTLSMDANTETVKLHSMEEKLKDIIETTKDLVDLVDAFNEKKDQYSTQISEYEKITSSTSEQNSDMFSNSMRNDMNSKSALVDLNSLEDLRRRATDDLMELNKLSKSLTKIDYRSSLYFTAECEVILDINDNLSETIKSIKKMYKNSTSDKFDGGNYRTFLELNPNDKSNFETIVLSFKVPRLKYYDYLLSEFGRFKSANNKNNGSQTSSVKSKDEIVDGVDRIKDTISQDVVYEVVNDDSKRLDAVRPKVPSIVLKEKLISESSISIEKSTSINTDFDNGEAKGSESFKQPMSIAKQISDAIKGITISARDDLYIVEYVFSNFSDNTIDASDGKTKRTLSGYSISEQSNYFYGGEVEYFLYGNMDYAKNISVAKRNIFGIRFAMNSIFAFTDGGVRTETLTAATAISAATMGVAPVPLIQAVLQLSLALAESAYDMYELELGKDVLVVKTPLTWHMSMRGSLNVAKEELKKGSDVIIKKATDYANDTFRNITLKVQDLSFSEIDNIEEELKDTVEAIISNKVKQVSSQIVDDFLTLARSEFDSIYMSEDGQLIEANEIRLEEMLLGTESQIGIIESTIKESSQMVRNDVKSVEINALTVKIEEALIDYATRVVKGTSLGTYSSYEEIGIVLDSVESKLHDEIDDILLVATKNAENVATGISKNVKESISSDIKKMGEAGSDEISNAGERLLSSTSGKIDDIFGSLENSMKIGDGEIKAGSKINGNNFKESMKLSYEGYLRLFLFLKLVDDSNESKVLLRISDLIQANINTKNGFDKRAYIVYHKLGIQKQYKIMESYTYVTIESSVELKPLFVNIDFIDELIYRGETERKDFGILKSKSVAGY